MSIKRFIHICNDSGAILPNHNDMTDGGIPIKPKTESKTV